MSATADIARVLRVPGRLVINPSASTFATGEFPFGGVPIGRSRMAVLEPLSKGYRVEAEGLGRASDSLRGDQRFVFACFLRGWDNSSLAMAFPDMAEEGATQHQVLSAPGGRLTGASALARGVVLLYCPDDTIHAPGVLIRNAVPTWGSGAELLLRRTEELGLSLTFECVRDAEGRILSVGHLEDIT